MGKYGNSVSGAMMGGVIAGPPGAAVGEVIGGLVDQAFGE